LLKQQLLNSANANAVYPDNPQVDRVLPLAEVERVLAVSHSTFHRAIRPTLPVVQLSSRRLGVRMSDLRKWQDAKIQAPVRAA
jgi:predicted DNA-binding transcriptional regulator AlpA